MKKIMYWDVLRSREGRNFQPWNAEGEEKNVTCFVVTPQPVMQRATATVHNKCLVKMGKRCIQG